MLGPDFAVLSPPAALLQLPSSELLLFYAGYGTPSRDKAATFRKSECKFKRVSAPMSTLFKHIISQAICLSGTCKKSKVIAVVSDPYHL